MHVQCRRRIMLWIKSGGHGWVVNLCACACGQMQEIQVVWTCDISFEILGMAGCVTWWVMTILLNCFEGIVEEVCELSKTMIRDQTKGKVYYLS
jgi:hypothetical protein